MRGAAKNEQLQVNEEWVKYEETNGLSRGIAYKIERLNSNRNYKWGFFFIVSRLVSYHLDDIFKFFSLSSLLEPSC